MLSQCLQNSEFTPPLNSTGFGAINQKWTNCYSALTVSWCQALTLKADSQPMKPQLRAWRISVHISLLFLASRCHPERGAHTLFNSAHELPANRWWCWWGIRNSKEREGQETVRKTVLFSFFFIVYLSLFFFSFLFSHEKQTNSEDCIDSLSKCVARVRAADSYRDENLKVDFGM